MEMLKVKYENDDIENIYYEPKKNTLISSGIIGHNLRHKQILRS